MADLMDQLVAEAERQDFTVRQTPDGAWRFAREGRTYVTPAPATFADWRQLLRVLREMGLDLPDL